MSADYPVKAQVHCTRDSDCRTGYACQPHLKVCRTQATIDTKSPTVEQGATLTLVPPPGLWVTPTAMGPGASARVTFTASEALSTAELSVCPDIIACVPERVVGNTWTFVCDFSTQPPDPITTSCDVGYRVLDLVGAEATGELGLNLRVDTEPPAELEVDTPGSVVLFRAPWGSESTGHRPAVRVDVAALAADEALLVWDEATSPSPRVVGEPGNAHLSLPAEDRGTAWVSRVDPAGNVSRPRGIRDVTFVASLGDYGDNPQHFDARGAHGDGLVRADAVVKAARDGLASVDGGIVSTSGAWVWEKKEYRQQPANDGTATAWNPNSGRITSYAEGTTLEWNGAYWVVPNVDDPEDDGAPQVFSNASMAYDPSADGMLMMGGREEDGGTNDDTWLWNGLSWKRVARGAPGARHGHTMTTDVERGRVLLFGGRGRDGKVLGDFWEWTGASWHALDAGTLPPARAEHTAVYESSTGRTWLFFGDRGTAQSGLDLMGDVWSFDGTTWTPHPQLSGTGPEARAMHNTYYETAANRIVVAAGTGTSVVSDAGRLQDAWALRDGGWVPLSTFGLMHRMRNGGLAYDPARDRVVRWGGASASNGFGYVNTNVWAPDAGWNFTWFPSSTLFNDIPSARTNHAMAYDDKLKAIVFQGGELGPFQYDDTFSWNGVRMARVASTASPGRRRYHAMTYDSRLGGTVMFGGIGEQGSVVSKTGDGGTDYAVDAGTWLLQNGQWKTLAIANPPTRFAHGMLFDTQANATVMVGGTDLLPSPTGDTTLNGGLNGAFAETWSLGTSGAWVKGPNLPALAGSAAATYDGARRIEFVVPGITPFVTFSGVYVRNASSGLGTAWSAVTPPFSPPQLRTQTVTYDSARERVLLFGAPLQSSNDFTSDRLWEWDGNVWSEAEVADPEGVGSPGERSGVRLAFLPGRDSSLLFGGTTVDAWEVDSSSRRPSHVFSMSLEAVGLPRSAEVTTLSVSAHAGASGLTRQANAWAPVHGLQLRPFIDGSFGAPLAASAHAASTPAPLSGSLPFHLLTRAVRGQKRFSVALVPLGVNGNSVGRVTTDYIEAVLTYRQGAQP